MKNKYSFLILNLYEYKKQYAFPVTPTVPSHVKVVKSKVEKFINFDQFYKNWSSLCTKWELTHDRNKAEIEWQ